jgi:hypothetical protein
MLCTFFYSNSTFLLFLYYSIFYIAMELVLWFFCTVYLPRSHLCFLKNFNESYKSAGSRYLKISSWPYPSSFAHENLVWLWVALCFKKTYYRNRWCPLFHNKDAMILLVLSVGVSNGCWFTSSRNVCVMHLPSFFKLSSAFLRLVLFFFNLEYF